MKNASILSNQDVSMAANENNNRSNAEILNDLRRQIDWVLGAYNIPIEDLSETRLRAKKDSQINALREFARASR